MAKKAKEIQYFEGVGRRKEAVARVRLYLVGKDKTATIGAKKYNVGDIVINDKPAAEVFPHESEKNTYLQPFVLTNSQDRFVTTIVVKGGGQSGQLTAIVHGLARALNEVDSESYRPLLKSNGLLTRDPRTRERRMVGTGGKSRRKKQSPKR